MKQILIIISLIIVSVGCCNLKKVFRTCQTNDAHFELYFIPYPDLLISVDSTKNLADALSGFRIDNNEIVKGIIKNWKFPVISRNRYKNLLYYLEISKNNETYCSFWLNDSLDVIIGRHIQAFNKDSLLKYKQYSEPVLAYSLEIKKLADARKMVNFIKQNNGYLICHSKKKSIYMGNL